MLTAEEARELMVNREGSEMKNVVKKIEEKIRKAIEKGEFRITFEDCPYPIKPYLEDKGYTVDYTWNESEEVIIGTTEIEIWW